MIEERTRELARKKLRVGLLAGAMPLGIYERGDQQVLLANRSCISDLTAPAPIFSGATTHGLR